MTSKIWGLIATSALLAGLISACTLGAPSGTLYVSPTGSDANDCRSPARPCRRIQAAIDKAAANDVIQIAAGSYQERLTVTKSISLLGASSEDTFLDGGAAGTAVVLGASSAAAGGLNILISGISIGNGYSADAGGIRVGAGVILTLLSARVLGNASDAGAAGILNAGEAYLRSVLIFANRGGEDGCSGVRNTGRLVMDASNITENESRSNGSAVCNAESGHLTLRASHIYDNPGNRAILNDGGTMILVGTRISGHAVFGDGGGIENNGEMRITGGRLMENEATGRGGAILNTDALTLTNVIIDDNRGGGSLGGGGGGIYNTGGVIISGGTIRNNHAGANGGGIYNGLGGLQISTSLIDHNEAAGEGGGLYNLGAAAISSSTFSANSSQLSGGAIANVVESEDLQSYPLTITDSTFADNSAAQRGGAVHSFCAADISGSTFVRNTAGVGGGINLQGVGCGDVYPLRLRNSTFSANSSGILLRGGTYLVENVTVAYSSGPGIQIGLTRLDPPSATRIIRNNLLSGNSPNCAVASDVNTPTHGNNLDSDGSCNFRGGGDLSGIDPGLARLGDHGGPTLTHAIDDTSPAADRGACTLPTDQRGVPRPQGGGCEIGAYEVVPSPAVSGRAPLTPPTATAPSSTGPIFTFTQQANCRKGPNTLYESLGFGQVGEQVPIQGLSDPAGWYYVQLPNEARCFAAGSTGDVSGSLDGLPVIPAPPLPAATATVAPPAAPTLSLNNQVCDAIQYVVRLGWTNVEGETGYRVYRDGSLIANLGANATLYDDVSPDYNAHDYRVEAFNSSGAAGSATLQSTGCVY
jgi:hypothetical protein